MRCSSLTLKGLRELVDSGEQSHDYQQPQERLTQSAASAELLPQWGKPGQSSGMLPWHTRGQEVSLKLADFGELPDG